jgi:hypothetical protein
MSAYKMNELKKELRSEDFTESLIVELSLLQTGTAVRAVQGGGSLPVKMLSLRIAMSFMLWKSDGLYCERSSRGETSLSSASALDMRRHFPKLGPFPSIHAAVELGEVAYVFREYLRGLV